MKGAGMKRTYAEKKEIIRQYIEDEYGVPPMEVLFVTAYTVVVMDDETPIHFNFNNLYDIATGVTK